MLGMVVVIEGSALLLMTLAKPCVGVVVVFVWRALLLMTLAKLHVGGGCSD